MAHTRKHHRPMPHGYADVDLLLETGYVSKLGLWLDCNIWRGYSPTATFVTNTMDRLPERFAHVGGFVIRHLGTANYFDADTKEMMR